MPDGAEVIDAESDEDVGRLVRSAVHAGISYYEGKGHDSVLLKWILGVVSSLAVAGIIGGIVLYGQVAALGEKVVSQQRQLDRIEDRVNRAAHASP